jgi:glycosyltransferase involved in cell wall biosynthesis
MKIVWMAYDRANYTGGPIINTIRLLPKFKELGHKPIALIAWQGNEKAHPNADYLISLGIECRIIKYPYYSIDFVNWILKQIEDIQPDVFVPNISIQGCFAGRWIKQKGIPVINTLRSLDDNNMGRTLYFSSSKHKKWNCSADVSVSKYLANQLQQKEGYYKSIGISVIPSGVPISNYKSKHNLEEIHVAYSGRLVQHIKRFSDTLKLFIQCANQLENTFYHIFGSGDNNEIDEYKKRIKKEGLSNRFIFHGSLKGDDYKSNLAKCHFIFLLSDFEGMPGALMDGMSCGLIPITSNFNGVEELIEHDINGFILEDSFNSINYIQEILSMPTYKRKAISEQAIKTINEKFSLNVAAYKWINVFEKLTFKLKRKKFTSPIFKFLPEKDSLLIEDRRKPRFKERIIGKIQKLFTK